ncbi:MAG: serine hydrolase [Bacteroidetes bacterium]|nr:serine hydrolase [Bacteroidota bacterium]
MPALNIFYKSCCWLFALLPMVVLAQKKPASTHHKRLPEANTTHLAANYLDTILLLHPEYFNAIIRNPRIHHIQIIYTQINRDAKNKASFTHYKYRLNKEEYFYAASMVKLPVSVLALEKAEELKKRGVTPNTIMLTDSAYACQHSTYTDTSSINGYPSIAQYVKRMLLVSDNIAYSRIYEFLTPEYIHQKLWSKGYPTARIRIRFDVNCLGLPNNYTNPIRFLNDSGKVIYRQPPKYYSASTLSMPARNTNKLIDFNNPNYSIRKDFTKSNYVCLQDLHEMLKSIMFPAETLPAKSFKISNENRKFLWQYLQMMPYESCSPVYADRSHYIDSYKKYLYYGQDSAEIINKNIRIFNVVGESYGYTTDCAYIVDFEHQVEFMVSATYYVQKSNGVIDGTDEAYNLYVMPFFRNLGQSIYDFELKRNKKYLPNLLEFKF